MQVNIYKFNCERNRRIQLNWHVIDYTSFLVNSIDYDYSKNCNQLRLTITPCFITNQSCFSHQIKITAAILYLLTIAFTD